MDLREVILCFVISVCYLTDQSVSFNIDVSSAKVFTEKLGTGFGYSAEFFRQQNGSMKLLVGAPRENITDKYNSGIYYICDPSASRTECLQQNSPPYDAFGASGNFGEEKELFGLSMTSVDEKTALVCGPMYSDNKWWNSNYTFNIGRCLLFSWAPAPIQIAPYNDKLQYITDITIDGALTRQMKYGAAEFGVSSDSDGEGRIVIGAPGYSVSRGGVVVTDNLFANFTLLNFVLDEEPDSLLGYAVAIGNFCGPKRLCFAASNRQVQGKVYILEHERHSVIKHLWSSKGDQEYSSFGSALCAVDVTGDGLADLLVGAPTYSLYSNNSQTQDHYDQGRVFVYISQTELQSGQDTLLQGVALSGDDVSFSRFGSAIGSIGDINRDTINDVAVGAPLQEEGAGALYIYLGSRDGLLNSYSQKILGTQFTPRLSSFGACISKATSRLSDYSYPDFAVGAPLSSAVVFLKTRLIVNAQVSVRASPNPVDKTNDLCPARLAQSESGCANVTMCLNMTYSTTEMSSSAASKFRSMVFNVALDVDQMISTDGARRVRLYEPEKGTTTTSLRLLVNVSSTTPLCVIYIAVLKQDLIHRNPFLPVQLQARFSLNTTSFPGIPPMLNQSMPDSVIHQLRFKNQCGQDQKCHTDLVLSGQVEYVPPSDVRYPFNVINDTQQVELVLNVVNQRETSFGMSLMVRLSGYMEFWTVTGNTSILCDDNKEDPSVLRCQGFSPIPDGEAVQVRIKFQAASVPLDSRNNLVTFEVKVMPFDPIENPEMKVDDNALTLQSRTAIVADVRLDGSSTPSVTYVADSDLNDVVLTHKLLVMNRGPSFLPHTVLNVTVPLRDPTGNEIVLSANVTIKQQEGDVIECPHLLTTGSSIGGDGTATKSTTTTTATTPHSGGGGGGGRGDRTTSGQSGGSGGGGGAGSSTTSDPFGGGPDIAPAKRKRRQAVEGEDQQKGKMDAAAPAGGQSSMRMDCSNYGCRIYQCTLTTLQPKDRAEVNITVILRRATITFPGNIDSLLYVTTTSVAEPSLALFYPWSEPKRREVLTQIKRVSGGGEINIWYIIGGVLGGLLLLLLIGVIAWRCGFFRRKDKAKLERLKRQSGFYDSNRSSKRKSQLPSTSGSAEGAEK